MIKTLVITGNGTNCEYETAHSLRLAGAQHIDIKWVWDLLDGKFSLEEYDFIVFPGGFLDGDHLGSGKAMAHRFKYAKPTEQKPIVEQLLSVYEKGGLILGICNGFQLLVKLGLLPFPTQEQTVTLTHNLSGRFEDRWVTLKSDPSSLCVFTKGIEIIELPVRHGEGRIVFNDNTLEKILQKHLVPFYYVKPQTLEQTEEYPYNPNGSLMGIASLTDPTGRIFGLMPHPEAFNHQTNHPRWQRMDLPETGLGVQLFKNALEYLK